MPMKFKTKTRKVSLPQMLRNVAVSPKSLDKEARTVDVIFTKGARVLRRGFFEDFFEELGLQKENVLMERLASGDAPVLDNHGFSNLKRAQTGIVESAKLEEGVQGTARLRFSKRAEVQDLFQDIEDGIVRNISVGYNILSFEKIGEERGLPIFRATEWEPVEISTVPAGADTGAQVRSDKHALRECVILEKEEIRNEPEPTPDKTIDPKAKELENKNNLRDAQSNGGNDMTPEEIKKMQDAARAEGAKEGAVAENKRQVEIRSIVKKVGLEDKLADSFITENKSVDDVRTAVIEALAEKDKDPKTQTRTTNIDVGVDNARKGRVEGMTSAILHRFRPKKVDTKDEAGRSIVLPGNELTEAGREFAYFSLVDMARACLEGNNIRTGMLPKHAIADTALNNVRGLHSISDFPEILANVANKTLRDGYAAAPQTWMPFTSEVFVSDFKEISRTNLGDAPQLEKLEEGSEVKRGSISEAAEKYRVEEFAKIVAISRKVIVNDDLGAFTKLPERMGRRAADLESDLIWEIYKLNAALADTFALFSTQHANLSTVPAAPDEAGLNEARASMRRKTGLDGAEISLIPAWIFVPPAHETATEKLIATTRPNNASDVNPFGPQGRTTLRMDVEPRLETGTGGSLTSWFVTADKGQVDMIELARLEGTNGPQIQTRDGFDVNGMEIKIMHDIGVKAIDFRGLFKNAGA